MTDALSLLRNFGDWSSEELLAHLMLTASVLAGREGSTTGAYLIAAGIGATAGDPTGSLPAISQHLAALDEEEDDPAYD